MAFEIKYALGGGFGGVENVDWEPCEAESLEEATQWAYEGARDEYHSYGGSHGLFNREDALEEDPDLTDDDLNALEVDDMEGWIEYEVREV